ncbi:MAG: FAD-dependent oxidoreductase, partial [Dehalococcoidia bacterium]
PVTCLGNAAVGREEKCRIIKTDRPRKVIVAGGGPGGMEAARVAALRGHEVSLCEKSQELGGWLNLAAIIPGREEIGGLVDYLVTQVKKLGVDVSLGVEVTPDLIEKRKPDVVIVATGSNPVVPDILGIDRGNVVAANEVLAGNAETGKRVVIVGGSGVGCDVAMFLARKGTVDAETCLFLAGIGAVDLDTMLSLNRRGTKHVTIVEMLPKIGRGIGISTRWTIMRALRKVGVSMVGSAKVERITDKGVIVEIDGEDKLIEADTVVIAVGHRSEDGLLEELRAKLPEVYGIGDCMEPRTALEAIREAYDIAIRI